MNVREVPLIIDTYKRLSHFAITMLYFLSYSSWAADVASPKKKIAVVTGSTRGIGFTVAKHFVPDAEYDHVTSYSHPY